MSGFMIKTKTTRPDYARGGLVVKYESCLFWARTL